MIRTAVELSTIHLPPTEVDTLSALISGLGCWPGSYEGDTGIVLPVEVAQELACPPVTREILELIQEVYSGASYVIFDAAGPHHPKLPTYEWPSEDETLS